MLPVNNDFPDPGTLTDLFIPKSRKGRIQRNHASAGFQDRKESCIGDRASMGKKTDIPTGNGWLLEKSVPPHLSERPLLDSGTFRSLLPKPDGFCSPNVISLPFNRLDRHHDPVHFLLKLPVGVVPVGNM